MTLLTDPFRYGFFGRALLAAVLVGAITGALGPFVVVRRMASIGQGLSQSVLGGVGIALVVGLGMYPGAALATVVATAAIHVTRRRGIPADSAIGIVAATMFAAGVAVISANRDRSLNTSNLLFGNILGVDAGDLVLVGSVVALAAVLLLMNYKRLLAVTHNASVAAAHGVPVGRTELVFNLLLALTVVTALQVLGVLLVAASLLLPAATASLVTASFGRLLLISVVLGAGVAVVGLYVSYYHNISSGPSIVLTGAVVFALTALGGRGGLAGVVGRRRP